MKPPDSDSTAIIITDTLAQLGKNTWSEPAKEKC